MFHVEPKNSIKTFHVEQSINPDKCPVCGSIKITQFLDLPDHFLTREKFQLVRCSNCEVLITSPAPTPDKIFSYYKSDEYVSHNDSKKGWVNFAYQQVKNITLRQKVALIKNYTQGSKLLDYGCGTGDFLKYASNQQFDVSGIEPDKSAREIALSKGISVHDISHLEAQKSSYDVVTLWHVLEHTYDPVQTLRQLKSLLSAQGILILALPNYKSADAAQFKSFWAAYDVPRHLFHFSQKTIHVINDALNMNLVDIKPMPFDAYYVSMLSKKYQTGNMAPGIISGWKSNQKAKKTGEYSSLIYVLQKQGD